MTEPGAREGMVTVACGAAVLVAMLAFLPVVNGAAWWFESALLVIVSLAVAAGGRRVGLPAAAAALVGVTTLPILGALIASATSAAAAASPAAAANAVIDLLTAAFRQIYVDSVPAADTQELALLMAGGAAVVALAADFVTVGLRAPVAGVLVVVAVAIVPGKAFGTGTNGLLLAAVGVAALAVVAADRRRRGRAPRIVGLATGGAVAVVIALLIQVVLPVPSSSQAAIAGAPVIDGGANPLLRLGQDLRRGTTTRVLSYTSGDGAAVYLRLAVLEDFEGDTWAPNPADGRRLGFGPAPSAAGLSFSVTQRTTSTVITPASPAAIGDRLPLPYPAVQVQGAGGDFRWESRGLTLARSGDATAIGDYTVTSAVVNAAPDALRAASVSPPSGDSASLELPPRVPAIIRTTAEAWTRAASTPYDEALAIQNRLRNGSFSYDEDTPAAQGYDGDGLGVIAEFLKVKAGYCIHFASTMAVMARLSGIPSRIVVGYQPGTTQSGTSARQVSSDDLHAWPELYFDGIGWVRFEPTPGRGAVPTYAPVPTGSVATPSTPTTKASAAAVPTPTPTTSAAAAAARDRASGGTLVGVLRGIGLVLAIAVLLAVPGLLRVSLRRRRLRRLDRDGAPGAWRELLDTVTDLGLPAAWGRSPREMEAVLAGSIGSSRATRAALDRLRAAYERQAYSRGTMPVSADDLLRVLEALHAHAGRTRRLLAAVAPRSLLGTVIPSRLAFRWSPPGSDRGSRAVRLGADR